MRGRFEGFLAGTALALILATSGHALAQMTPAQIDAAVPMPEVADVPPPSAADVGVKPAMADKPATTAPAAAAAPAANPVPAPATTASTTPVSTDPAFTEKLRDLVTTKLSRYLERKNERTGVENFYSGRNYAPLWTDNGSTPNARAAAAVNYLKSVAAEGLDPADYPVPDFAKASTPEAQAEAEIRLTESVITFARHAQTGRVHWSRISDAISYNPTYPDAAEVLENLSKNASTNDVLAGFNPPHAAYKALKAKLAEARARKGDAGPARIEDGPVLKVTKTKAQKGQPAEDVTMDDPRVPQLRKRLGVAGDANNLTYDRALADAVSKFQTSHGLKGTGQLTQATIDALNGPRRDRDADVIIANMERWRWVPRDFGRAHVVLNIPDYTLRVMNNGKMVWTTKVVIGKPGKMATPLLSETIKYITVNPTWNVPPSIINNEYLPALQQDPEALARIGLKVTQNADGSIRIYQPPGDGNALGRLRFNFPNKFLVYQHDTSDKHLFAHEKRAYSHGCMRVQNPDKYAEVLLGLSQPNEDWSVERIRKMYGNAEQNINLTRPVPVHITYQTAFVDDAGHLQIREDVYGRDASLLAALKSGRDADVAIARANETTTTVRRDIQLPDRAFNGGRQFGGRYASEGSFFDRLFGGGRSYAPPPPPQQRPRTFTR